MSIENIVDQNIHLVNRSSLELTDINDVSAFTDTYVEAEYSDGCIAVEGADLKIIDFSSQSGVLKVKGYIDGMYFIDKLHKKKKKASRK